MSNKSITTKEDAMRIAEDAISKFNSTYEQKTNTDLIKENKKKEIIENKLRKLLPILALLTKLKELGITVPNSKKYNVNNTELNFKEEVLFKFSKRDTVGRNAPGIDLIVEHPCFISITIPNEGNGVDEGCVVINVGDTLCPDVDLIKNKTFYTIEAATQALATFFAKNTINIMNKK